MLRITITKITNKVSLAFISSDYFKTTDNWNYPVDFQPPLKLEAIHIITY